MKWEEIRAVPNVVVGILSLNFLSMHVLFDLGVTHFS
jgi:hypothetical protein